MAYSRREVQDYVTIMNKDLYDNLQDGVEEAKEEVVKKSKEANLYTDEKVAEVNQYVDSKVSEVNTKAETATSIAKGRNKAKVFSTTEAMQIWLSTEENKGLCNVGDNLYIVDTEVPDWWIAEVLNSVDEETGYYYKIAQLETQKVDLTDIYSQLGEMQEEIEAFEQSSGGFSFYTNPEVIYLVESGSVYADENGNYVLSSSETGKTLLENSDHYYSAVVDGDFRTIGGGADTVTPFNNFKDLKLLFESGSIDNTTWTYTYTGHKRFVCFVSSTLGATIRYYTSISLKINGIEIEPFINFQYGLDVVGNGDSTRAQLLQKIYLTEVSSGDIITFTTTYRGICLALGTE